MIHPTYLSTLRRQHRCELVLTLVQLEQIFPGWWLSMTELAEELGTDRASLNRSISKLEALGLLRRTSLGNGGGTWIWWVRTSPEDAPQPDAEPAWVVRNIRDRNRYRIPISDPYSWAQRRGIPRQTMRSFLGGHQLVMRNQWQLVSTPTDGLLDAGPSVPLQAAPNESSHSSRLAVRADPAGAA